MQRTGIQHAGTMHVFCNVPEIASNMHVTCTTFQIGQGECDISCHSESAQLQKFAKAMKNTQPLPFTPACTEPKEKVLKLVQQPYAVVH